MVDFGETDVYLVISKSELHRSQKVFGFMGTKVVVDSLPLGSFVVWFVVLLSLGVCWD